MKFDFFYNHQVDGYLWQNLLKKTDYASPFQTPDFYDFFNKNQVGKADVYALGNREEYKVVCVVTFQKEKGLNSFFTKRAIIYGGPLIANAVSDEDFKLFFKEILDHCNKKAIYLEIRNYFDYSKFKENFVKIGFEFVPWLNYQLISEDYDQVKSKVSKSRYRQIKNALKQGVTWREAASENEVQGFYYILRDLYKNKIKRPLFDLQFFLNFFHSGSGKYLLVFYQNKVIGGIMCPILPGKAIYEFYVCGLDVEYKNQHPSIVATWAAIEYAIQNNMPLFDFMGAGKPDESYGVRDFKARFGGELVNHGRFLFLLRPSLYQLGKIVLKLLKGI